MTRFRRHCATCMTKLRRGAYRRCAQGCGATLCRTTKCIQAHASDCIVSQVQQTKESA